MKIWYILENPYICPLFPIIKELFQIHLYTVPRDKQRIINVLVVNCDNYLECN